MKQQIAVTPFRDVPPSPGQPQCKVTAAARFTSADGAVTEAEVTLFQLDDGRIGAGVHPAPDRGAVLRWDAGPHADPAVIYWQAPHCGGGECDSPCEHRGSAAPGLLRRAQRK
jgi:hypothetical protein